MDAAQRFPWRVPIWSWTSVKGKVEGNVYFLSRTEVRRETKEGLLLKSVDTRSLCSVSSGGKGLDGQETLDYFVKILSLGSYSSLKVSPY